ncbi:MAG: hypothetical protein JKX84_03135 [Flavobacteriales bacterium]|nr:hypothetical protein [Flavobacteriales bacterium]
MFLALICAASQANAQLVDGLIGQKRTIVQVMLRPFRIMDYEKQRVVYNIAKGVHQTILYKNDTCVQFYWAVSADQLGAFKANLLKFGYSSKKENGYVKDSLELVVRLLASGKATLFMASISNKLTGNRDAADKPLRKKRTFDFAAMPLLQQAILEQENDTTTTKKPKNPERYWVGDRRGKAKILGWEK